MNKEDLRNTSVGKWLQGEDNTPLVVRCKDCKHYCPVYADTMGGRDCLLLKTITRADDFCSYGERRE